MPLTLRSRSKARIEVQWDGALPIQVCIFSQEHEDVFLYQKTLGDSDRFQLELGELDFSAIPNSDELHLVAKVGGENQPEQNTEPLAIQKCSHASCGLWGHVREDGYCKHCGRRIRTQKTGFGFPKLEINNFSLLLWNGMTGHLWKKQESREENDGVYSLGLYSDKDHTRDYVEILEERFVAELSQHFIQLQEILQKNDLLGKTWRPPIASFQEEYQRAIWVYYPWLPNQVKWRYISAASYIATPQIELLTLRDIITIGIELCQIAQTLHTQGYQWGSLKLSDLILCRHKGNNISMYLRSRDITWEGTPPKSLLDPCLMPLELYWEESLAGGYEVTEIYIIAAAMYFLAAKSPNLLSYNVLASPCGIPSLKLFRLPDMCPLCDTVSIYFESVLNQALLVNPADRGYKTLGAFKDALEKLLQEPAAAEPPNAYVFDVGEALDTGSARREDDLTKNQDAAFVTRTSLEQYGWGLFVLCDGISTSNIGSGDIASQLVMETVQDWWKRHSPEKRRSVCQYAKTSFPDACLVLNQLATRANLMIRAEAEKITTGPIAEESLVMGTTVVIGIIYETSLVFGWLGDSPLYRISPWGWERLNFADNERSMGLQEGRPLDEFKDGGNALTACLGARFYKEPHIQLHFGITQVNPGEAILACSDGIPDYIEPESFYVYHENYQMMRIASILHGYQKEILLNSSAMASVLVSTANRIGGGYDNLGAVLIRLLSSSEVSKDKSFERLRSYSVAMQNPESSFQKTQTLWIPKDPIKPTTSE